MFTDLFSRRVQIVLGLAAVLVTACADNRGGPIPYDVQLAVPDAPTVVPLEEGYRIAPLDKLTIKVLKMEDLSGAIMSTLPETSRCP